MSSDLLEARFKVTFQSCFRACRRMIANKKGRPLIDLFRRKTCVPIYLNIWNLDDYSAHICFQVIRLVVDRDALVLDRNEYSLSSLKSKTCYRHAKMILEELYTGHCRQYKQQFPMFTFFKIKNAPKHYFHFNSLDYHMNYETAYQKHTKV